MRHVAPASSVISALSSRRAARPAAARTVLRPQQVVARSSADTREGAPKENVEEVTRKYGLEAGLLKAATGDGSKEDKISSAKDLLKRYGSAYLLTSISLSLVSFTLCYLMVENGVDVAALLGRVGLTVTGTSEKVGTVALAYAAHKAASPIRFPPTVALTPLVARMMGKEGAGEDAGGAGTAD